MHELTRRLKANPKLMAELSAATACLNLLALADTIYVMILLRRYIAYGFDGTLVLLTAGVLVAVGLQWGLMSARGVLASGVGVGEDERLAAAVHEALVGSPLLTLEALPRERATQAVSDLGEVQASCDANNVCSLLDAPFALMFAVSVYFLSPLLAVIVTLGIVASIAIGWNGARQGRENARAFTEAVGEGRAILASSTFAADTVRLYRGASFYRRLFRAVQGRIRSLRGVQEDSRSLSQALGMGVGVLVRVALYAVGAKLAVEGEMSVAALIGASILGSYAIAKASGSVQVGLLMARGQEAMERLGLILELPREREDGQRLKSYDGGLELRGLGFSYGGEALFSGLDISLPPGGVLVVRGYNGSGKTTLLRILAGLIKPTEGAVLAAGLSLAEATPAWWRAQVVCLPQEPFFLAGTIRQNILMAAPDTEGFVLQAIVRRANLGNFLDTSAQGVETPISSAGGTLPVGIRKRLALARTLAGNGRLALLDEPTAGMDEEGTQAVYNAMNTMAREGRTLVVVSGDPNIVKGAHMVLDMGIKPVPSVTCTATAQGDLQ